MSRKFDEKGGAVCFAHVLVLRTLCPSPCRGGEGPDGGPFDISSMVRPSLFKADAGTAFAALGHPIAQGSALKPQLVQGDVGDALGVSARPDAVGFITSASSFFLARLSS